jgi:hypothetical protein
MVSNLPPSAAAERQVARSVAPFFRGEARTTAESGWYGCRKGQPILALQRFVELPWRVLRPNKNLQHERIPVHAILLRPGREFSKNRTARGCAGYILSDCDHENFVRRGERSF